MTTTYATRTHLIMIFIAACAIRALTFYVFIAPHEWYKQADSNDYHIAALCLSHAVGMCRPDTLEPLFWRTPGYPAYLVPFYKLFPPQKPTFSDAHTAQQASIWIQIILSSFIPLILFYLALYITHNLFIAYAVAFITVIHLGLILASCYLLTEGIALIPFYLFLYFFYTAIINKKNNATKLFIFAACTLALYTWIRPMGNYVAIVSAFITLITPGNFRLKSKHIVLFLSCFYLLLAPWYVRNYLYTGHLFFCPMFGAYLNSFCAPRIVSVVENIDLVESWKMLGNAAYQRYLEQKPTYLNQGIHLPREFVCGHIAWPIIFAHPLLALYDWIREILKTTFDLYSSQLVAFVQGCFFYDPLIEYLSVKIADCLYNTSMPLALKTVVYLELLYALMLWIGLIGGFIQFMVIPSTQHLRVSKQTRRLFDVWLYTTIMIAAIIFMTGGFGYARLRLPVEPLMIILSLTWWHHMIHKVRKTL